MARGALLAAMALLAAGCTATPPAAPGAPPPPAGSALPADFLLATLEAHGDAGVRFTPERPVLELAPSFLTLDEAAHAVTVWNPDFILGRALLRLDDFGEAGWALLPGGSAELRVARGEANATFGLLLSEAWLSLEQVPGATPGWRPCHGNVTYMGDRFELGQAGGWTTRVRPGETATIVLDGPPPCDGLRLAFAHRGTWAARAPP